MPFVDRVDQDYSGVCFDKNCHVEKGIAASLDKILMTPTNEKTPSCNQSLLRPSLWLQSSREAKHVAGAFASRPRHLQTCRTASNSRPLYLASCLPEPVPFVFPISWSKSDNKTSLAQTPSSATMRDCQLA